MSERDEGEILADLFELSIEYYRIIENVYARRVL